MKALVLGGSGFIGSHVVRALQDQGIGVRVMMRRQSSLKALEGVDCERVVGDLDNFDSIESALGGCEALFHVASYYPVYSYNGDSQKKRALTQMGHVLRAARHSPTLKRMVYTSSLSTIGHPQEGLGTEETPYDRQRLQGLYYEIKYLMEQEVLASAREGLPVVVVNPTGVFGDYDVKPTSGIFILIMASGKIPFYIDGKMNAVDVRDVARAQVNALEKGRVGERYILGGHNSTIGELAKIISRLAGKRPPLFKMPLALGYLMAHSSEWFSRNISNKKKPAVPLVGMDFLKYGAHFDSSKAQKELDLHTTPLEETFGRALNWFKENAYLL